VKTTLSRLFDWAANLWVVPSDSEEERLGKAILTFSTFFTIVAATFWVVLYGALGLWLPAAIPLTYQIVAILAFVVAYRTKRFDIARFSHTLAILLLPFFLQWSLGGFAAASVVLLWALSAPVGALMYYSIRQATMWFAAYIALLLFSGLIDGYLSQNAAPIPQALVVTLFLMNIAAPSLVVFILLRYFAIRRREALDALDRQNQLLQVEQERSEHLLLNILPESIAQRLKGNPGIIADAYDEISVLFADIVSFTPITERTQPDVMVQWLNSIFSAFDGLAEKYGLEKIRTMGDSYMAVGGAPIARPDHAEAVANMALDMLDYCEHIKTPDGEPLRMRIGINTGPAIAAVMGVKKFIYDVYGDAVNTASRMESQGIPGSIQVTETTYSCLCDHYEFDRRGMVQVKGKGEMMTYLLLRVRGQEAVVSG